MDSIAIYGGKPILGEISTSGSKNAALPIMTASILTSQSLTLKHVPNLTDIKTMCDLLQNHGVLITKSPNSSNELTLNGSNINSFEAPYDVVRKMRASIWVLGPLLARFGRAKVSMPGGCAIGGRQVDMHLEVLQSMGADISLENGYINAKAQGKLKGTKFHFSKVSVGATINAIMAAALAKGESQLSNCAIEPEIVSLCECLLNMGAEIEGIGTPSLKINGCNELSGTTHKIIPDRIEAGTLMISAAITRGKLKVRNLNINHLRNLCFHLEKSGANLSYGEDFIEVSADRDIKAINISTQPYPGFATDLQAQFMALMSTASGTSVITENIFENRFMHVHELNRLGANIIIDGHNAIVTGVKKLKGAEVMATDLRASVSLVLAGMAAEGETIVNRVYHIDRGYENIEQKLQNCGIRIHRFSK